MGRVSAAGSRKLSSCMGMVNAKEMWSGKIISDKLKNLKALSAEYSTFTMIGFCICPSLQTVNSLKAELFC
jgi:hypothetical protein